MNLRYLDIKDAELMLEWMHDLDVVSDLYTDFMSLTLEDCKKFIKESKKNQENLHLAIVDQNDTYMGTVSLKHIDEDGKTAEFAITIRSCAMGKGFSKFGMTQILQIGIEKIGLKNIYWCVSKNNIRAIRFYDKNMYNRTLNVPNKIINNYELEERPNLIWYVYE